METHIEGTIYGDSYRGYNVWGFILRVQRMESIMQGTMYGESYSELNVWRLI